MAVRKIPSNVQSLLNASARISNYKSAIEELVYNSLDAESSSIAIRVHIQRNWLQVVDNGNGIKSNDFEILGQRYATSKLMDINNLKAAPSKFGYQGQSLANIKEVSETVKITSRCENSNETWLKTFSEGKATECRKVAMRPSKGTTVEVHGFLFNLNIQRKYISPFTELQDIKMFLEHLLLAFNNVSISLRDDSDNEILFKIHKNRDIYQTFKSLLDIDLNDMQELQVQKNEYKVKAFIGIKETEIRKYHWIYINNKFVYNSNLHELINCKLSKTLGLTRTKIKKNRIKAHLNEDIDIKHQSVPFYFLFLTCPYCEYDIVYSGKETTIEFKDWTEINKIIEKLVQFFNGDIQSNNVKNQNQKQGDGIEDTKNEVKNIIEKFLGNYKNKKLRVPQMQNGVKGKDVKRKMKKERPKIFSPKLKRNTTCKFNDNENNKVNSPENKTVKIPKLNNTPSKQYSKLKSKIKNRSNQKNPKFAKRTLKYKCNEVDNLIETFKKNTETIKRRCKEISCHLKDLMDLKSFQISKATMNQVGKPTASENPTTTKACKKIMKSNSSEVLQQENCNNNKKLIIEKPKSYDLLQTIFKTSQGYGSENENTYLDIYQNTNFTSKLTYESHKYNMKDNINRTEKKCNNLQFSKQSRENFIRPSDKIYKKDLKIKQGKITKPKKQFKSKCSRNHDYASYYKLFNKYKNDLLDTHFSIDTYEESDIIEVSKKIRNQILNDMKFLLHNNKEHNKVQSQKKCVRQSSYEVNFKIESTYTILVDSIHSSSRVLNKHTYRNDLIEETVETKENKSYNNNKTFSTNDEVETIYNTINNKIANNKLNVFIPESLNTTHSEELMEPIDLCEVVITNSAELAEEFNDTFGNNNNDSVFMVKYDEKNDINIPENQNCDILNDNHINNLNIDTFSNTSLNKNVCLALQEINSNKSKKNVFKDIFDKQLDNAHKHKDIMPENEACILKDRSNNNFELFSRHRFMPKGTSQIFNNVFSKSICSYNLDTEYYKDIIYDNFVKEIEMHTEIYEPKIQNMNDHTTGHIQKITDKLKNNNANLIFEAESLADAKVLKQVDCKFIAATIFAKSPSCESSEFLVLFDQHAVHERIKLENNLEYYFNGNHWKSITIRAIPMKITKDEILYLHNHKDKFTQCGIGWTAINNCEILVTAVPEAIVGKNPRPDDIIIKAVKNLLAEQIDGIKCLKGNVPLYPQSIMNLVSTEACRYAIKFGDILSDKTCQQLISELAKCKSPFQCAHGRPVMAVMVELKSCSIKYEADMLKLKLFKDQMKR